MIATISLLVCASFSVSMPVGHKMTDFDFATVNKAAKRCKTLYSENHCLNKFNIVEPLRYTAQCKKEKSID